MHFKDAANSTFNLEVSGLTHYNIHRMEKKTQNSKLNYN